MPQRPPKYRPPGPVRKTDFRPTSSQRGYDARWRRARLRFLKANPLCVHCLRKNRSVVANQVDHIDAVTGPDDPKFWDITNWQPLCDSCHSRKTVLTDGGFGNG